jgi:uncharacterized protein YjiS (DUF1127 family)
MTASTDIALASINYQLHNKIFEQGQVAWKELDEKTKEKWVAQTTILVTHLSRVQACEQLTKMSDELLSDLELKE